MSLTMLPKPKNNKKVRPQKASRTIENKYRSIINKLANGLKKDIRELVLPILNRDKKLYQDSLSSDLDDTLSMLKTKYSHITKSHIADITQIVNSLNRIQKNKFINNVNSAIGVDLAQILQNESLEDFVNMQINKNVSLVKSIPDEFFKQIEAEIYNGVSNGATYGSIAKRISGIKDISSVFGKLSNRTKFIARNEVENINAALVKKRSEKVGLKKFIWQTSRDERVRGNPAGLYPDAKCSHYKLDGKEFTWADGANCGTKVIYPGSDFNCRCVAINIIEGINDEK